jgi:hypothetical protein
MVFEKMPASIAIDEEATFNSDLIVTSAECYNEQLVIDDLTHFLHAFEEMKEQLTTEKVLFLSQLANRLLFHEMKSWYINRINWLKTLLSLEKKLQTIKSVTEWNKVKLSIHFAPKHKYRDYMVSLIREKQKKIYPLSDKEKEFLKLNKEVAEYYGDFFVDMGKFARGVLVNEALEKFSNPNIKDVQTLVSSYDKEVSYLNKLNLFTEKKELLKSSALLLFLDIEWNEDHLDVLTNMEDTDSLFDWVVRAKKLSRKFDQPKKELVDESRVNEVISENQLIDLFK